MAHSELIAAKKRAPKGARGEAWGILNPYRDLWTWQTFHTEDAALEHVYRFWGGNKQIDLSKFKPVRVKVHVTALRARAGGGG